MTDPWDPWGYHAEEAAAEFEAAAEMAHVDSLAEQPDPTPALTRADAARAVAMYSAIGKAANDAAKQYRTWLDDGAVAEMDREGYAPKGEIPGLGSWALKLTTDRIDVTDHAALLKWVQDNRPEQVKVVPQVEIVQPAFVGWLLKTVTPSGDGSVALPETGEVVPGLRFVAGGQPAGVAVTPKATERERIAEAAHQLLAGSAPALPGGTNG